MSDTTAQYIVRIVGIVLLISIILWAAGVLP